MDVTHSRRFVCATFGVALALVALSAAGATGAAAGNPRGLIVHVEGGPVQGIDVGSGYAFRGLAYAAPPVGDLRWRPPQPPAAWHGVRDASQYAPSCPQAKNLFQPPGPESEECLYLNVSTPTL